LKDEDIALKGVDLAVSMGAEYAEIRLQSDDAYSMMFRNGQLEVYGYGINKGLSVRIIKNGSMGFATTDKLTEDELAKAVKTAVRLADAQGKGKINLSEEKVHRVNYTVKPKVTFEDISLEEKIEFFANFDKELVSLQNSVKIPNRSLMLDFIITKKTLATNEGALIISEIPRIRLMGYFVITYQDRSITRFTGFGETRGWEAIDSWEPVERFKGNLRDLSKVIVEAKEVKTDNYDIILGSETSGLAAHESCGHPFELDRILGREGAQAGESFITTEMLGKRISREIVTVIDDPTIPNSYGFYLYDDEGVKARPRYLIYKGLINEFLMNRETASVLGLNSNAAARASYYNREPIVRMANTYFAPGDYSFDELLEDVRKGIYIKSFGEWNIDDRRYNMRFVGLESYLIENGEVKFPLWNPIFEITTPKFYESIDAVDKNLEFDPATCGKSDPGQGVPVFVGGPNLRVRGVKVFKSV
jgi:TldD protein